MSWLEEFAITMILGILNQVIKDPAKKAELQGALLGLAADIYAAYGQVPPTGTTQATDSVQVRRIG
jgi:hypothetical protein